MNISLTTFVDYVVATGQSKVRCVRNAKADDERGYDVRRDYWRPLRKEIIAWHQEGGDREGLAAFLGSVTDRKKVENYRDAVEGYLRFVGRKDIEWRGKAPVRLWAHDELEVRVNPEIVARIGNRLNTMKLYFKAEPLSKRRIDPILYLLEATRPQGARGNVGIVDVRRGKLHVPTREIPDVEVMVRGEAASFVTIWKQV